MSNINFNNPYLLLIGIPLLLVAIIPFFIAVKKSNANIHNKLAFAINIIICLLVTLVAGGMRYEKVITETQIYVLADVSYSTNSNLDLVDQRVKEVVENSPSNSKIGLIAFGKDYQLLANPGEILPSVSKAKVDRSQTNIADVVDYASTLFDLDVIKRIVLISDGKETNSSNIVSVVNNLSNNNISVDAIYIDSNIKQDINEIQINQIDYVSSTYLNAKDSVDVLIQSNNKDRTFATLKISSSNYSKEKAVELTKGFNIFNLELNTSEPGKFDYTLELIPRYEGEDSSDYNNTYNFTLSVSEKVKMLVLSEESKDKPIIESIYGNDYEITYFENDFSKLPSSITELCEYDEFLFSNVNVANIPNSNAFLSSVDTLVSEYGKSLITLGNTYIQGGSDDDALIDLNNMLPVKFGKQENNKKLVTIIIDVSISMMQVSHLAMAKSAACQLVDLLEDEDMVAIVAFSGEITTILPPTEAANRESIKQKINAVGYGQGTYMGLGMKYAYSLVKDLDYSKKEFFIISDGMPYSVGDDDPLNPLNVARTIASSHITISTFNTQSDPGAKLMSDISVIGKGHYYYAYDMGDVNDLFLTDIPDDIQNIKIEGGYYNVSINHTNDKLVADIDEFNYVNGFYYNKPKTNSTVVMNVSYVKDTTVPEEEQVLVDVPLYAYWNYGVGKVSSFSSTLSSYWTKTAFYSLDQGASDLAKNGLKALLNVSKTNIPESRIDSPFIFEYEPNGTDLLISVTSPFTGSQTSASLEIVKPDGTSYTKELLFDSEKYFTTMDCDLVGRYGLALTYNAGDTTYNANSFYDNSYLCEYDSFASFDESNLYYMVTSEGQIFKDSIKLENNELNVITYTYDFTISFMIGAVALYVISIIVRKIRWADIRALFVHIKK